MTDLVPPQLRGRLTVSVPEAGALLGLARNSAYDAAKRGDIPTLALGRRLVVPVARLLVLVGIDPGQAETAAASAAPADVQPLIKESGGPKHAA